MSIKKTTKPLVAMKGDKPLKILAPIGAVPSEDKDLHARIAKLGDSAGISDVLREITDWEKGAVRKFKEHERTTKSGMLEIICW